MTKGATLPSEAETQTCAETVLNAICAYFHITSRDSAQTDTHTHTLHISGLAYTWPSTITGLPQSDYGYSNYLQREE